MFKKRIVFNQDTANPLINITESTAITIQDLSNKTITINIDNLVNCHLSLTITNNCALNLVINVSNCQYLFIEKQIHEHNNISIKLNIANNIVVDYLNISLLAKSLKIQEVIDIKGQSTINIDNLFLGKNADQLDYHVLVNHAGSASICQINSLGILYDDCQMIFNIVSQINKGIIKCSNQQKNRLLLIGENCRGQINPIQLIQEHDVSANHGAAIGTIKDQEIFYLMSRGLTKNDAITLITYSMVNKALKNFQNKSINQKVKQYLERR